MSAYEMELRWAISSQIDSLRNVLLEYQVPDKVEACMLRSGISSAPHNESLFDSVTLCVKIEADGSAHLRGTLTDSDGETNYGYYIKSFPSFKELLHWYTKSGEIYKTCLDKFDGRCDVKF